GELRHHRAGTLRRMRGASVEGRNGRADEIDRDLVGADEVAMPEQIVLLARRRTAATADVDVDLGGNADELRARDDDLDRGLMVSALHCGRHGGERDVGSDVLLRRVPFRRGCRVEMVYGVGIVQAEECTGTGLRRDKNLAGDAFVLVAEVGDSVVMLSL